MVPTTISAGRLTGTVLPHLAGRAIRVPTVSVSCTDLTIATMRTAAAAAVNALLQDCAFASPVFGWTEGPLVSCDPARTSRDRHPVETRDLGLQRAHAGFRLVRQ